MVINDLVQPVISKLRNRSEMKPQIPYYIAQVLLDLSENTEFEELKVTGPLANFVQGVAEYPLKGYDINGITGNPFIVSPDHAITFIGSWFRYFNTSGNITPGQDTGSVINGKDLHTVDTMSKIFGLPTVYNIHGSYKNHGVLIVGQMPDNPYACQMRYQHQHTFNMPMGSVMQAQSNPVLGNQLGQAEIFMPSDWSDIIVYAAAEKVCDDIGMNEIGQLYHQKLYGYKDKKGNEMPGLITVRLTQQERQSQRSSRALRPMVRRVTG